MCFSLCRGDLPHPFDREGWLDWGELSFRSPYELAWMHCTVATAGCHANGAGGLRCGMWLEHILLLLLLLLLVVVVVSLYLLLLLLVSMLLLLLLVVVVMVVSLYLLLLLLLLLLLVSMHLLLLLLLLMVCRSGNWMVPVAHLCKRGKDMQDQLKLVREVAGLRECAGQMQRSGMMSQTCQSMIVD